MLLGKGGTTERGAQAAARQRGTTESVATNSKWLLGQTLPRNSTGISQPRGSGEGGGEIMSTSAPCRQEGISTFFNLNFDLPLSSEVVCTQ